MSPARHAHARTQWFKKNICKTEKKFCGQANAGAMMQVQEKYNTRFINLRVREADEIDTRHIIIPLTP